MNKDNLITETDTIFDIVTTYPATKDTLLELSPKFAKLNNPLLFNTVARLTTVAKAADMGKLYLRDMLYELNATIGKGQEFLSKVKTDALSGQKDFLSIKASSPSEKPVWMNETENFEKVDARSLGEEPFPMIVAMAEKKKKGEGVLLIQAFEPTPMISYLQSLGFESYVDKKSDDEYQVFFYKK